MRFLILLALIVPSFFAQSDLDATGVSEATRLNMLRLQRIELIKELSKSGVAKSPAELNKVLQEPNPADPRLGKLKTINEQIQTSRVKLSSQKTPAIESSSRFGLRYRENQAKVEQYKRVLQNAQSSGADPGAIQDLKLMQKRTYMERSELVLKHQLLEDGTFSSIQKLNQSISTKHADPRVKALAKVQQDLSTLQINRSQSAKVGQLTKQYLNPAPTNNTAIQKPTTVIAPTVEVQAPSIPKNTAVNTPVPTKVTPAVSQIAPRAAQNTVRTVPAASSAPKVTPTVAKTAATVPQAAPSVPKTVTAIPKASLTAPKAGAAIPKVTPAPVTATTPNPGIVSKTISQLAPAAPKIAPTPQAIKTQPAPTVKQNPASILQPVARPVSTVNQVALNPRSPLATLDLLGSGANSPKNLIQNTISQEITPIANELQSGIKTNSIQDYVESVKTTGNKVTDKVLGGAGDEATGRDGYQVRRDSVVQSLTEKVTALTDDIAAAQSSGNTAKAQKLQALQESLKTELRKAEVGPQNLRLQSEITGLKDSINSLKQSGANKDAVKSLQDQLSAKEAEFKKSSADSAATAKNYIRDGLHFAVIAASTQGVLNIIQQVKDGEEVDLGNAFNFITTPDFLLGTTGAFAGGLLVQKGLTTGFGKIAMATVQNMVPGPVKFIVQALPYTIGAMLGSDIMTGNFGKNTIVDMAFNGIGSSVGMMLGSAIFPPIGSIAGSVLGALAGDYLSKMIQGKDQEELATEMLYEPQWQELQKPGWEAEDQNDLAIALHEGPALSSNSPNLISGDSLPDLETARDHAYEAYRQATAQKGGDSDAARQAYGLFRDLEVRIEQIKLETVSSFSLNK
ncbi:MAG: hypothetical protein H3C47_03985 [Candidatus Cloacimonetes bacterium]|nr:hypothetical protein [Candidatus Cloacimonadota bacterium]